MDVSSSRKLFTWKTTLLSTLWLMMWFTTFLNIWSTTTLNMTDPIDLKMQGKQVRLEPHEMIEAKRSRPAKMVLQSTLSPLDLKKESVEELIEAKKSHPAKMVLQSTLSPLDLKKESSEELIKAKRSRPAKMVLQSTLSPLDLKKESVEELELSLLVLRPTLQPQSLRENSFRNLARVKLPFYPSKVDYSDDKSYHLKLEQMQRDIFEDLRDNNVSSLINLSGELIGPYEAPTHFNVLLASQRTGSTFIGSILAAHPGTFYHYEPTNYQGLTQARNGSLLSQAERVMMELARCDVSEAYINTSREKSFGLHQNAAWTRFCGREYAEPASDYWCWSREVLRHLCRTYPVHLVKSNGVRLDGLLPLLVQSSRVRVLLTGRDPRAVRHSRRAAAFCKGRPLEECDDPLTCADMVRDYHTAVQYDAMFPGRIRMVRLEDINNNPLGVFEKITEFFNLRFTKAMKALVNESSTGAPDKSSVWSTKRDAKFEELQWRRELLWDDILKIQSDCQEAMRIWGYNAVTDEKQLNTFEDVADFKVDIAIRPSI